MSSSETSRAIRARLDHPVIDIDGHCIEFFPGLAPYLREEGVDLASPSLRRLLPPYFGPDADWHALSQAERERTRAARPPWWGSPARNTRDLATAMFPGLLYERLDELGIDVSVVYPSVGLAFLHLWDDTERRGACRALNRCNAAAFAEYSDRLVPVAAIPMHTPDEAIAELDYAVGTLGFKAVLLAGYVQRPVGAVVERDPDLAPWATWLDMYGIDSAYDYDPVWQRCVDLGVAVAFHSGSIGWGSRRSISNYMYNHIGHLAEGQHALCKSLFFGGVPKRFPELNFAFLEGGVSWAATLLSDLIGHWEKRNRGALAHLDPAAIDRKLFFDLMAEYGGELTKHSEPMRMVHAAEDPEMLDEFAACGIEAARDIVDQFVGSFSFGCEADDPLTSTAFNTKVNPFGARLGAMFGSDVAHWDVPDMSEVLEEAWEMVDHGWIDTADFRDFVFGNPVRFFTGTNPTFFEGTIVEAAVAAQLGTDRSGVMLDLLVRGGTVVDGTGAPGRGADIGVRDGEIVAIGAQRDDAVHTIDADGLVIAPGFIDLHTHYDAQVLWDPGVSPSPLHGVTTVIGGNCGFSIAPLGAEHVDYIQQMMARVEGMSLTSLRAGPAWDWETFGDYLERVDGNLAINAGFLAGHSTIRRVAMGAAATERAATADELAAMVAILHTSLAAGALGFSSSLGEAHTDGAGAPVPSRAAHHDEFVALARTLRDHEGTMLEFIPAVGEISADRMELMAEMSLAANRPLNWNLLGSLSPVEIYEQQLQASDVATARGAEVFALTLPDLMRLRASHLLESLPGWKSVVRLPDAERRAAVHDPSTRERLCNAVDDAARGGLAAMADFDLIEIAQGRYAGRTVAAVARELGVEPADVLVDVVLPDRLALTLILPSLVPSLGASQAGWEARAAIWRDPRVLLGGSDAGAHIDLMCHGNYPSVVLGHAVRERKVIGLETAVHLMTDRPARVLGLRGRGRIAEGWRADLAIFDPARIASDPAEVRADLPANGERLHANARGMEHVIVGGRTVVRGGVPTGDLAGSLLRSGRDTETVTVPGGGA